ncbi:hypothetical protein [Flavobacterium sp.]|uniref:hypothetical protein n=1 Tax=Flavobacterium sp. TaxID=239 RepID=UPI0038FC623A
MVLINQKDCLLSRKNLGISDCILQEGRLTGFIIVPKGWSIDLTADTFNLLYVNEQIQLGNFVPVLGAVEATNGTPEATTEEYQGGVKSVVRNGLPEYSFKYLKGWKFASALYTYNSFQAFDVLYVFSSGSIAGATNGTTLSGFDLGMLNSGTYMFTDGATSSSVTVSMQLVNEEQFNRDYAILDASVLDFKVNTDIYPITDIAITGRADVSDQKVYFKPVFETNKATTLGGIAIANLRVTVSGTVSTITALSLSYNASTKEWSFTPTTTLTTSTPVIVELYDSVEAVSAAKIGAKYYRGISASITPVA